MVIVGTLAIATVASLLKTARDRRLSPPVAAVPAGQRERSVKP